MCDNEPYKKLSVLIRGYGYNANRLAQLIGCTQPTAQKKLDNPTKFTIGDLDNIAKNGRIPIEELRNNLTR